MTNQNRLAYGHSFCYFFYANILSPWCPVIHKIVRMLAIVLFLMLTNF